MNNEKIPYSMMTLEQLREEFIFTLENRELPTALLHEAHRRLWSWILEHADEFPSKRDWPGWDDTPDGNFDGLFGGRIIYSSCFLCTAHAYCHTCPLYNERDSCALYYDWSAARDAFNIDRFRELTMLILNAPNMTPADENTYDESGCC